MKKDLSWSEKEQLLVKLIDVNNGRHVTLIYFSLLISVNRKHRLFGWSYVQSMCL